jgi:type IX secretion system PorP/SprF family membrane protein
LNGEVYRAPDGSYEGGAMVHNDDMIPVSNVSSGTFDMGFGVYLNVKNFYAGVSSTHLLNPTTSFSLNSGSLDISYNRNIYFMAGYNYEINKTLSLRPSVMYKSDLVKSQIDVNANLIYEGNLWAGVSYRGLTPSSSDALILLAGVNITNQIALGYSYDVTTSGIKNYSSGSHEIVFNYKLLALGKKGAKLIYCPRFL